MLAEPSPDVGGNWRSTTFGSAIDDWQSFTRTLLNGLTFAALLFIVASGFSLIFGLMRVVNMAYGSFYLVGGYVAYEVQQRMTGTGFTIPGIEVSTWEWVFPAIVAAGLVGLLGLVVQQLFLSWNQGQELRQALITIAISVIIADQVIAHFNGGLASTVTWPGWTNRLVELPLLGVDYSLARLVMLFLGIAVGLALWVWLYRTRTGMVIRAGVDDLQMTSALGVNIKRTLAIAFVVGSALAAFGGVVGALAGRHCPGPGRAVAAQLARRRDHRRDGLAARCRGRLVALRPDVLVLGGLPADDRGQLLHPVLDRLHLHPARPRARLPPPGPLRESSRDARPEADHRAHHRPRRRLRPACSPPRSSATTGST